MAFGCFLNKMVGERIEQDKDANLFTGMRNSAFLTDYNELLPYETDNPQYLFDFAKTLREEKRYMDSNAILRRGTLVSADPMFYIIMGNNYRDEQLYDMAREAYEKAYAIMPNRLYPLYQLMMMYDDTGNKKAATNMAKRIKHSYVKIPSKATEQMVEKADSILRS
jgi:tetratricopeptide (TPR) repeat protein